MRIYIAGKISGFDEYSYRNKFANAEKHLRLLGHDVINPTYITQIGLDESYRDLIMEILGMILTTCDAIYMLDDWTKSEGAKSEYWMAKEMSLKIYYQSDQKLIL